MLDRDFDPASSRLFYHNADTSLTQWKNPPELHSEQEAADAAFKLGSIAMNIDLSSVTSKTILIKTIIISGTEVIYEFGDGGSNVDIIGKNVDQAADGSKSDEPKKDEGSGKKLVIENFVIVNGKVSVSHPLLKGKKLASSLPAIRLKDIGKGKKDGASPAEVVDKVMDVLEKQVSLAVGATDRL